MDKLSNKEIIDKLKELGIKGYSGLKKPELLDLLNNASQVKQVTLSKIQAIAILKHHEIKFTSASNLPVLLELIKKHKISLDQDKVDSICKQYIKNTSDPKDIPDLFDYSHITELSSKHVDNLIKGIKFNSVSCQNGQTVFISDGPKYKAPILIIELIDNSWYIDLEGVKYQLSKQGNNPYPRIICRYDSQDGQIELKTDDIERINRYNFRYRNPDNLNEDVTMKTIDLFNPSKEIYGYDLSDLK